MTVKIGVRGTRTDDSDPDIMRAKFLRHRIASPFNPNLEAAYTARLGNGPLDASEDMLMIWPILAAIIMGAKARIA